MVLLKLLEKVAQCSRYSVLSPCMHAKNTEHSDCCINLYSESLAFKVSIQSSKELYAWALTVESKSYESPIPLKLF